MNATEKKLLDRLRRTPAGCWEWTGPKTNKGYGKMRDGRKTTRAHRVAYRLFCADVTPDVSVCHRCDNRLCCNPTHLFPGSAADNNRDMYAKGRASDRKGEKHGQAKLTESEVREMRRRRAAGETFVAIGSDFGVSATHARRVVTGTKWGHVV